MCVVTAMRAALLLLFASSAVQASPCSTEKLAAATRAAWGVDNLAALDCRRIRGQRPLLLVQAALDGDGKPAALGTSMISYAAIVDPATTDVWWHRESYAGTPGSQSGFAIADLDRDGRDELIEHITREGHMGSGSEVLVAYAIRDAEVTEAGTLTLSIAGLPKNSEQNGCHATWAIVGGPRNLPRIQVIGVRDQDRRLAAAPDECPHDGTHRYRWTGAAFALAD